MSQKRKGIHRESYYLSEQTCAKGGDQSVKKIKREHHKSSQGGEKVKLKCFLLASDKGGATRKELLRLEGGEVESLTRRTEEKGQEKRQGLV